MSREAYDPRHLPSDLERGLEATAYWEPLAYTYPCSASVAVVELDKETGAVTLTKYIYVDDCGTVVNPLIVDGQVHGGLAQGIGAALLEEAVWDDRGQLVTGSFMDYALPSAAALPRFTLDRMVTPSPHNPLGCQRHGGVAHDRGAARHRQRGGRCPGPPGGDPRRHPHQGGEGVAYPEGQRGRN